MRRFLHAAAHLALWAGLYVTAAVVSFAQIAGVHPGDVGGLAWTRALAFAFCVATGVYLLDRVKLRDAWLDPADAQAHPERYDFLRRHTGVVRVLLGMLLAAAAWLGASLRNDVFPWAVLIPPGAALGVLAYAARPRGARARPKDMLLVKNLYVAAGITGFAALTALAVAVPPGGDIRAFVGRHAFAIAISCGQLFVRVVADAVLCDLDDRVSDMLHGTRTLPGSLGHARAWNVAMGARLAIAGGLVVLALTPGAAHKVGIATAPLLWWAGVTAASSVVLRVLAPTRVRDWVDARFALEAVLVTLLLR